MIVGRSGDGWLRASRQTRRLSSGGHGALGCAPLARGAADGTTHQRGASGETEGEREAGEARRAERAKRARRARRGRREKRAKRGRRGRGAKRARRARRAKWAKRAEERGSWLPGSLVPGS